MACGFLSVGDEGLEGDGVIVLLDHQSGLPVSPPLNHLASVERTFFDPACSKLLSASLDHSARIWKLTEDDRTEHELRNHAIILSGAEINKSSQAIAVKPARLAELFSESYENSPRYFSCSQDEIERWQKYVEWVIKQYAPL
jgi:WD40 repeat protein